MKQISYGQMVMILLISRIFKTITYNPFEFVSCGKLMIELILSAVVQGILILPFIYIYRKYPGESLFSLAGKKSNVCAKILAVIYSVYFFLIGLRTVKYFAVFMAQCFPQVPYLKAMVVALIIIACYGALLGITSVGRTSAVVTVFLALTFITIILTSRGNINILNLTYEPINQDTGIFEFLLKGLGYNIELVTIAVLLPYVKNRLPSGLYSFIGIKLVVTELVAFLCVTVLGSYVEYAKLPFFKLGAYSKTQFFERFDALYMTVWVMCAIMALAYYLWTVTATLKAVFISIKSNYSVLITSAVVLIISMIFKLRKSGSDFWYDKWLGTVLFVALTTVIPLVIIAISRNKKGSRRD